MPNNSQLLNLLYSQQGDLNNLYNATARELAIVLKHYNLKSKTNIWIGNKNLEKEINVVLNRFNINLKNHININIEKSWNLANTHNNKLTNNYLSGIPISDSLKAGMMLKNTSALAAFIERKRAGLNLSDRVWNITNGTKDQLESLLQSGITDGTSAVTLTKDLRRYLKNPEKRFRRLRNAKGKLVLSNPAKNFHPGRGVYRSSFKNALRLARNETNMAYRSADHLRRMQLPFVTGIDVHLSNAHPAYDICDELQGEYPKNFKFYAWHANCICFTTNKLLPKTEFVKYLNGDSVKLNRYTANIPGRAQTYLNSISRTLKSYKNKPYFIADNFKSTKNGFDLKNSVLRIDKSNYIKKITSVAITPPKNIYKPINMEKYEDALNIKIDDNIFNMLTKQTPLNPIGAKYSSGPYYNPARNFVKAPISKRAKNSKWHSKSVIYHEFGHASDWQRGFRHSDEIKNLMMKYRTKFSKESNKLYNKYNLKISKIVKEAIETKNFDKLEQVSSFADTLMSLNTKYGYGHSVKYFSNKFKSEAEFIAHAFENNFLGNKVFKEVAPELYEEMIKLVESYKTKQ